MPDPLVVVTAGCILTLLESRVEPIEPGWREETSLRIQAREGCSTLTLLAPPNVTLGELTGRIRAARHNDYRLQDWRFEHQTDLDGTHHVTVHTQDLVQGDVLDLQVVREWKQPIFVWQPGLDKPAFAELRIPRDVPVGAVDVHVTNRWAFVEEPSPTAVVRLGLGAVTPPSTPLPPAANVDHRRVVELHIDHPHPRVALMPGGASHATWQEKVTLPTGGAYALNLPSDHGDVTVTAPDDAQFLVRRRSVLLEAPVGSSATFVVTWEAPDAPVHGETRLGDDGQPLTQVIADGAVVSWEVPRGEDDGRRAWRLASWGTTPILPDRDALIAGLVNRFNAEAYPEPAVPPKLRGHRQGWDLAASLLPALLTRATVAEIPIAPLWPRRLVRARAQRLISPIEASLILWLYANQSQFPATWALVRPADEGRGWVSNPEGYTDALVRIQWADQSRWMDPGCNVCTTWEVRPHLQGTDALGPGITTGPVPTEGLWRVETDGDETQWTLVGPAALLLRIWLDDMSLHTTNEERTQAVAFRMGGVGTTFVDVGGIDQPGAPIRMSVRAGDIGEHPFEPLGTDGPVWWNWVGTREWIRPGTPVTRTEAEGKGWRWMRTFDQRNRIVEVLEITHRQMSEADADRLRDLRMSAAEIPAATDPPRLAPDLPPMSPIPNALPADERPPGP